MKTAKMKKGVKKTAGGAGGKPLVIEPKNGCRPWPAHTGVCVGVGYHPAGAKALPVAVMPAHGTVEAAAKSLPGAKVARGRMMAVLELLAAVTGKANVPAPLIMDMAVHLGDPENVLKVSALALRVVIADGEAAQKRAAKPARKGKR